jgi:predicted membrane-bound mannosyltransferase
LLALGARPLGPNEARHALYAYDLVSPAAPLSATAEPIYGGWLHLLTAGIFAVGGASDFTTRLVVALSGLLLIAMAFELRHYVGRAGGLALATMLTLSPSVTWFSRANANAVPTTAMALVTITVFMALVTRPGGRRAAALGLLAGLMLSADPSGLATGAIFLAALIPLGLWELVKGRNRGLAIRVWFDRYSKLLVIVIVTTAAVCALSQMTVPSGWDPAGGARGVTRMLGDSGQAGFVAGMRFCLPVMTFYEFLIVLAGLVGAVTIIAARVRSRFAAWCLIWAAMSTAFFLWTPVRATESMVAILPPIAVVGAIGLDWLHHREAWRALRVPLAVLAAITFYVGAVANFVCAVPDASEAPWARHANLFWDAPATTEQARLYARQAAAGIPPVSATVFFAGEITAPLRWYLRDLRPVSAADTATVFVTTATPTAPEPPPAAVYHFDYAEDWRPNFGVATTAEVLRFLLGGKIWGPGTTDDMTIIVRKPTAGAPTVILTPGQ